MRVLNDNVECKGFIFLLDVLLFNLLMCCLLYLLMLFYKCSLICLVIVVVGREKVCFFCGKIWVIGYGIEFYRRYKGE